MFRILIHSKFEDHIPDEYESFDNLKEAYRLFNGMRGFSPFEDTDEGVELVYDRTADDGFAERITLEYFDYV